jgi:hypothetical protein
VDSLDSDDEGGKTVDKGTPVKQDQQPQDGAPSSSPSILSHPSEGDGGGMQPQVRRLHPFFHYAADDMETKKKRKRTKTQKKKKESKLRPKVMTKMGINSTEYISFAPPLPAEKKGSIHSSLLQGQARRERIIIFVICIGIRWRRRTGQIAEES